MFALSLSWLVLAKADFLYPLWHDHFGIEQGIDKYGAKNRYKKGFESSSKTERYRVFSEINKSVHSGGRGLSTIEYQSPTSNGPQFMLRHDEVVHLQDVANLIDLLQIIAGANGLFWLILTGLILVKRIPAVTIPQQLLASTGFIGVCLVVLVALGPNKVFNHLHIWVFPDEHEWFFYYQDSLMSTLMMAPTLFAYIAIALVLSAIVIYLLLLATTKHLLNLKKTR